jgi:1-acyl-sn-glycerol-3-phosphate acyltransferase
VIDPDVRRAIDALPNRVNELGYDAWGFHPETAKRLYTFGKRVFWPYFRPEVHGAENIPPGRVLIVPNHAGQLPFDGIVVALACLLRANPPRVVRAMVERIFPRLPYVNELLWRGGAVLGDPVNCKNLLEDDQAILVFPEGARGSGKTWWHRYKLVDFGRGFMRLALQTKTPIVPTAVIGGEESIVSISNFTPAAKLLGVPYIPIAPLLPLLGPLAYLPAPVKFRVWFGRPMRFEGRHDDEDAAIDAKVAVVKAEIQRMIDDGLARRTRLLT